MKKIKQNFIFLCDEAFLGENKKLSIIGIFTDIYLPKLPSTHLKSVLVGNFDIVGEHVQNVGIAIDLVDENNNPVGLNLPPINLSVPEKKGKDKRSLNFILEIGNMKFDKEGKYRFIIRGNDEIIGETEFRVLKRVLN